MAAQLPFQLKNPDLFKDKSYIHGKWQEATSGARFDVVDPGTGNVWASVPDNNTDDVDAAVQSSHEAFQSYRKINPRARARWLLGWDALIRENKDDLAKIITYETGKPIAESLGEIEYSLGFTWWFAGEAERIQGTVQTSAAPGRRVFTVKQPIGVAVGLVPWNFPVAMVLRKASAAFAAGCTMIVKPSPETPLSALSLAYLAEQAGFPKGVLNVLTTSLENTPPLSETLCRHPLVKKVTFTGSTRVGKLIAKICAEGLKKVTLELGGNCPVLIFEDANLEHAVNELMTLKFRHAGQACITANRVYVQRSIYETVASLLSERMRAIKLGHGADSATVMGPLTTERGLAKAHNQLSDALRKGARNVHRTAYGEKADEETHLPVSGGYFFPPALLLDATSDMDIATQEIFGPILALYPFDTEEEAIRLANGTSMGLASYFFTSNVHRTWRLLEELEAGMVGMNVGNTSAAESPFGGIKESGYGKESGKDVAVAEYLIVKTGTMKVEGLF